MRIIEKIQNMQELSNEHRKSRKLIAVVPTMGYLHDGHCSLIRQAKNIADIVITTLFVNPTQFAPNEDFSKYPRDFQMDCYLAEKNGTDYLFYPSVREMYPEGYNSEIKISGISKKFEGAFRPTHFNGVATVVAKLFNATLPDFAFFGQKDYQQTLVIKQLVRDFNLPVKLIVAKTRREDDGLAMSSRNVYLSPQERENASIIYKSLIEAKLIIEKGERNRMKINQIMIDTLSHVHDIEIDYASSANADTLEESAYFKEQQSIVLLIACKIGKTRLIDNMVVALK